jgi:hypothetical protein
LEFEVRDPMYLRVSPMKGVKRFGVKGKLTPRYIRLGQYVEFKDITKYDDKGTKGHKVITKLPQRLGQYHPIPIQTI